MQLFIPHVRENLFSRVDESAVGDVLGSFAVPHLLLFILHGIIFRKGFDFFFSPHLIPKQKQSD